MKERPAVFLDRDGVLCMDTGYITSFEKFHIYPFAHEAVELIHTKGYLAIVVTNQSGVARKWMTEDMVKKINVALKEATAVDAIYYCPHLPPEKPYQAVPPYRIYCDCRKPGIGMIEKAQKEWNINLKESIMVGDRESDIIVGIKTGMKTVRITEEICETMADSRYGNLLLFAKELSKNQNI